MNAELGITLAEAAERFDVPIDVARRWTYARQKHRLTPVGHVRGVGRGGKIALYEPSEVEERVKEWRAAPRRTSANR